MLNEYRNIDLRAPALDAIGRLTRNDIIWACTVAMTASGTEPLITPSQLDPAFSRMRGYTDYYTAGLVLRNDELPVPNHRLAKDCPVVMFLGRRGTKRDAYNLKTSHLTTPAKKSWTVIEQLIDDDMGFFMFDMILVDPRWPIDVVLPIALRKMQEAYPARQLLSFVFPGRTMQPKVFEAFVRFRCHPLAGSDMKRFIIWAKSQPCLIMFSAKISDTNEQRMRQKHSQQAKRTRSRRR